MEKFGDQAGPSGLVARPDSPAVVAVKVLEEKQVIAEVRIVLHPVDVAKKRAASRRRRGEKCVTAAATAPVKLPTN